MTTVDIRVGDCRTLLRAMPAESVDCVVADPPYQQTSLEWDRWPEGWPEAVRRVLKPTGSMWVFGSLRMFMERRDEFRGWRMAQDIVWKKHNGSSFHADRFRRAAWRILTRAEMLAAPEWTGLRNIPLGKSRPAPAPEARPRGLTATEAAIAVEMFDLGCPATQIAEHLGRDHKSVRHVLAHRGRLFGKVKRRRVADTDIAAALRWVGGGEA